MVWPVVNPQLIAHLLVVYWGKRSFSADWLITKHQPKWICLSQTNNPNSIFFRYDSIKGIRKKSVIFWCSNFRRKKILWFLGFRLNLFGFLMPEWDLPNHQAILQRHHGSREALVHHPMFFTAKQRYLEDHLPKKTLPATWRLLTHWPALNKALLLNPDF